MTQGLRGKQQQQNRHAVMIGVIGSNLDMDVGILPYIEHHLEEY